MGVIGDPPDCNVCVAGSLGGSQRYLGHNSGARVRRVRRDWLPGRA